MTAAPPTATDLIRAFVKGYWLKADQEINRLCGKGAAFETPFNNAFETEEESNDYWYNRGIRDLAEMTLNRLAQIDPQKS
jgi:hypothetical protein